MVNLLIAFYSFWVIAFWIMALIVEYRPEIHLSINEIISVSVFVAASLLLCLVWPIILLALGVLVAFHTIRRRDKK